MGLLVEDKIGGGLFISVHPSHRELRLFCVKDAVASDVDVPRGTLGFVERVVIDKQLPECPQVRLHSRCVPNQSQQFFLDDTLRTASTNLFTYSPFCDLGMRETDDLWLGIRRPICHP